VSLFEAEAHLVERVFAAGERGGERVVCALAAGGLRFDRGDFRVAACSEPLDILALECDPLERLFLGLAVLDERVDLGVGGVLLDQAFVLLA